MSDVQPLRDTKTNNRSPVSGQAVSMARTEMEALHCGAGGCDRAADDQARSYLYVPMFFHAFSDPSSRLSLAAPDVLNEAVALGQSVQGIVGLAHGADEAAEGVDVVLAGDGAARLVNLGDGNLDRGVVLGLDDAVGGRALAGDVAV